MLSLTDSLQSAASPPTSAACHVSVCGQLRAAAKVSSNADDWFSAFLSHHTGRSVRCTLMRSAAVTSQSCSGSSSSSGGSSEASFANTAQFLLLSSASIKRLIQVSIARLPESTNNLLLAHY